MQLVLLHPNLQLLRDLEMREKLPSSIQKATSLVARWATIHKPCPVMKHWIETFPGRAFLGLWKAWRDEMAPACPAGEVGRDAALMREVMDIFAHSQPQTSRPQDWPWRMH